MSVAIQLIIQMYS